MGTEAQLCRRWETARRYYVARVQQDLFGTWVVCRAWGGRFNRLGRMDTQPVESYEAGVTAVGVIDRQRRKRNYFPVKTAP